MIRLLPVYLTYLALSYLLKSDDIAPVLSSLILLSYNFKPFLETLHWSHFHTHLWTIALDIQLIGLIIIFSLATDHIKYRASQLLILSAPFVKGLLTFFLLKHHFESWRIFLIGFYTPLYQYETIAWGYLLYHSSKQDQKLPWTNRALILSTVTILILGILNVLMGKGDWEDLGFNNEFGLYNPVWIYSLVNLFNFSLFNKLIFQTPHKGKEHPISSLLSRFGDISFTFYLYHFPIQYYFMQLFNFKDIYSFDGLKVVVTSFTLTLLVSIPLYRFVELPADMWQKALGRKMTSKSLKPRSYP